MDTSPTPTALMFACLTEAGTVAAETAVCARHVTGFDLRGFDDVTDWTLIDCTGTAGLVCTVCGADAEDLAYAVETGHNVRPTTTVTVRIPATVTLTVTVDSEGTRYYAGSHRVETDDAAVTLGDAPGVIVGWDGPPDALGLVDRAEVERLVRTEVDSDGIFPAPHWS